VTTPAGAWLRRAHDRCLLLALVLLALLAVSIARAGGAQAQPFSLGFYDTVFAGPHAATWLHRAASAGADVVEINIGWVAPDTPTKPAGFNALDPDSPYYDFSAADAAVKAATADGLRVILEFTGAPSWAEGADMPASASPGTWKPNDDDIEQYAVALATRYSGHFPDPGEPGRALPRVWAFLLWNEPNLPLYLAPQFVNGHAVSPVLYRGMLNAFYRGIKSRDPNAVVATAGTGPFGDPAPLGPRMSPALFWRVALCVREVGTTLHAGHCKDPAHFDALTHHPYSVGPPPTAALNADDVSIPDMWKLTDILSVAERAGTALPHIHHQLWATETGYNTRPPNPKGIPVDEDARWLEQTLALLWRQGVSLVTWNLIVDQAPDPSYFTTYQSGVYYLSGRPKPALGAFSFPLVAWRQNGTVQIWGRAPKAGRMRIEQRLGNKWVTVKSLTVHTTGTWLTHLVDSGPTVLRGQVGGRTSLPWRLS
jgi:hypothetical protein